MLSISKASAGSGKTYKLAYEYIKLVLGYKDEHGARLYSFNSHENHKKILAITFTNKATEEMKQRIVKELAILSGIIEGKESSYLQNLSEYYNVSFDEIKAASKKALIELLHNFSDFNISTIDSFFQVILRTFTREVEIGADFGIELNDEAALNIGIRDLISNLRRNSDTDSRLLRAWLLQYIRRNIDSRQSWDIFKQDSFNSSTALKSIARYINTEDFKQHKDALLEYLTDKSRITKFQAALKEAIETCRKDLIDIALDILSYTETFDIAMSKGSAVYKHIIRFANTENEDYKLSDAFLQKYESPDSWMTKKTRVSDEGIAYITAALSRLINKRYEMHAFDLMLKNIFALGLLGDICKNIQDFRSENDVILLSDTNELLRRIINRDDTPFIYERIGIMLQNFLIDEFQDTSRMQWENIRPLLEESLGHDHDNLIIGDEKQSIYRFRNADPSLLQKKVFSDFSRQITEESHRISYSTNWRSSSTIVRFNNTFFSLLPGLIEQEYNSPLIKETYSNVIQYVSPNNKNIEGYITVNIIPDIEASYENPVKISWKEQAMARIPAMIEDILKRGYSQKDVAILVNTNVEGAEIIDTLLTYAKSGVGTNLRVVSDESLLLKNSSAINLITTILEFIDCKLSTRSSDDDDTQDSDKKRRNDGIIPLMLHKFHKLLSSGVSPSEAIVIALEDRSEDVLQEVSSFLELKSASLFSIVELVISKFVPQDVIEKENSYINAFQDVIIEYSRNNIPSLHAFIGWWNSHNGKLSITSPANIDAINILTIHKSKGLEYPCVLIPFANWDISSSRNLLWLPPKQCEKFPKDIVPPIVPIVNEKETANTVFNEEYQAANADIIIDNLNKTYVAFTRAVNELHITTAASSTKLGGYIESVLNDATENNVAEIAQKIPDYDNCLINISEQLSQEHDEPLTLGHPTIKKEENKKEEETDTFKLPLYSVTSGGMERYEFDLPEIMPTLRTKGILYHRIMSLIKRSSDVDLVLRRLLSRGAIDKSEYAETLEVITRMIKQPEAESWFAPHNRVMNERPITKDGKTYRADRIITTPDGKTIVIDYKFGEGHKKSYHTQVSKYISLLKECGISNISGKIWYPLEGCIETV